MAAEQPELEPDEPVDRTPQPNQILAEPATIAACQQDFGAADDVRDCMDRQGSLRR